MFKKVAAYIKSFGIFKIFITLFLLGLLYGSLSLYIKYTGFSKFMNQTRITSVKAKPITINTAQKTYKALSIIESLDSIEVTSKVNGLIDKIHFKEGTLIKKDDLLFSIISSDKVGLTKIFAPFSGIIGLRTINAGESVIKGQILATLDDYSYMKVPVDLPERILPYLSKKLMFTATSDNISNLQYNGILEYVDTRINPKTRTIGAYALIDNKNLLLKPGVLLKVSLLLEEKLDAVLIPEESLLSINSKHYVYVIKQDAEMNDIAILKNIIIGIRSNAYIEVQSGLSNMDKIIYMGQEKLKDGSRIKVIE